MATILKPLDLAQVIKKPKKNGKLAKRLEKIRQTSGATKLQAMFRGRKARLALAELVANNVKQITDDIRSSNKELKSFNDIPFSEVRSVQCCVDAAEGLPKCCTATRVTVRLLSETRQQIGDVATSICNMESDPHFPTYTDCIGSWDKSMLSAETYTFLIRLDTLERPSLHSSVVGYSVIKLCTDHFGNQPATTSNLSNKVDGDNKNSKQAVLLNSGLFRIPVFYGKLISDPHSKSIFNEFNTSVQLAGKLPDTYIYVRIFDSTIDKPSPFSFIKKSNCLKVNNHTLMSRPSAMSADENFNKAIDSKWDCVVLLVLSAQYATNERCGRIVFPGVRNKRLYDRYISEYNSCPPGPSALTTDELVVVFKQMLEWVRSVFSPYHHVTRLIDLSYAYCYKDSEGFCVSVDGLYNMTASINYSIVESSLLKKQSAVVNGEIKNPPVHSQGTSRKEIGTHAANIKKLSSAYKVSFRYLRGAYTPFDAEAAGGHCNNNSALPNQCPKAGVNNLSNKEFACSTPQRNSSVSTNQLPPSQIPFSTTPEAASPPTQMQSTPQSSAEARQNTNTNSPGVQLQRTSPAVSRSTSPVNVNPDGSSSVVHHPDDIIDDVSTALDFYTSKEAFPLYYDAPKIVADMQLGTDACVLIIVTLIKLQVSEKGKIFVSMQYGSDSPAACNYYGLCPVHTLRASPYFMSASTPKEFLEEKSDFDNCYVNMGTFQVPLFMGTIPQEVLQSDTPYKTLCSMIRKQNARDAMLHAAAIEENKPKTWFGALFRKPKASNVIVPDTDEDTKEELQRVKLTTGASVLLRMSDARLYAFNNPHIGQDFTVTPNSCFVEDMIGYYSRHYGSVSVASRRKKIDEELNKLFKYDPMKFDDDENLKKKLPAAVVSGRSLWSKVTEIYTNNVLDFHESN